MSHENLTTIGAALQAEYQTWLAQSVIVWPEQFQQASEDWDVLRSLNAELAETLRPVQECIELDSWLASGFFALPVASPAPEASVLYENAVGTMPPPGNGLPPGLLPANQATLPESIFTRPMRTPDLTDKTAPGRYTKKEEAAQPSQATPTVQGTPVKAMGGRLRDLARLAQNTPIADDAPTSDGQAASNTGFVTSNHPPSLSASGFLAEEQETPKLPTNFFGDIPAEYPQSNPKIKAEANFHQRESNITTNTGLSPNPARGITTAAQPTDVPNMESANSHVSLHPVMPAPSFEQTAAKNPTPASLPQLPRKPSQDADSETFSTAVVENLTPASLLHLTHQLEQDAGTQPVPAAASGVSPDLLPANVDFAAAAQMPIDFQRVLMALPFGNLTARADLPQAAQAGRPKSASVRDGQVATRNRSTGAGAQDTPEAEPALIVEQRVQAAQNAPSSSIDSEIDVRDLLDTLSQEIWREYQRYYGR
jgi:hypothetical protein